MLHAKLRRCILSSPRFLYLFKFTFLQMVYKGITTNEQINAYRYNHFKNNCQGKSPFE